MTSPAPHPDPCERPGLLLGISNVLTKDRSADPGPTEVRQDFDLLRETAVRALAGFEAHIHDAVFLGLRIRLFTNSHHLADFWRETTWTVAEWMEKTGRSPSPKPDVVLNAVIDQRGMQQAAYLRPDGRELLTINSSHFGEFRRRAMELISPPLLAQGCLPLSAAAVVCDGRALLLLGPSSEARTLFSLRLLPKRNGWLSDEFVAIRFHRNLRSGGTGVKTTSDRPIPSWAFPLERRTYLPTSCARFDPELIPALLRSRLENVPDTGNDDETAREVLGSDGSKIRESIAWLPPGRAEEAVARLLASPESRAVLDPAARFGKTSSQMSRIEAVPVSGIVWIERGGSAGSAMRPLPPEGLLAKLNPSGRGTDLERSFSRSAPAFTLDTAAATPEDCLQRLRSLFEPGPTRAKSVSSLSIR